MKKRVNPIGKRLEQSEMKRIKGAEGAQSTLDGAAGGDAKACWIHTYSKNGTAYEAYAIFCSGSAAANQHCVDVLLTNGNGVFRCTYNCD